MVEVPAQLVPGPALQSFLPALATPKHFSVSAAVATFTDPRVSAVVMALATMAEVALFFIAFSYEQSGIDLKYLSACFYMTTHKDTRQSWDWFH
jgi:hypothetical protein